MRQTTQALLTVVLVAAAPLAVPAAPGRLAARSLEHDGRTRSYLLAVPDSYDPARPAPLVLAFHGSGQTARSFARKRGDLVRRAAAGGIILAFPQSTRAPEDGRTRWYSRPDLAGPDAVDDVGFVLALVAELRGQFAVDPSRVYATGFSNGGSFTHLLAVETEGVFAAVAPVATGVAALPAPREPIPVMMINGKRDRSRPYDGGLSDNGAVVAPAAETVAFWVAGNGCAGPPAQRVERGGAVVTDRYAGCAGRGEVVFVTLERMTHRWPDRRAGFGYDANRDVLAFFARHRRP